MVLKKALMPSPLLQNPLSDLFQTSSGEHLSPKKLLSLHIYLNHKTNISRFNNQLSLKFVALHFFLNADSTNVIHLNISVQTLVDRWWLPRETFSGDLNSTLSVFYILKFLTESLNCLCLQCFFFFFVSIPGPLAPIADEYAAHKTTAPHLPSMFAI